MKKIFDDLNLSIKDMELESGMLLIEAPANFIVLNVLSTYAYIIFKAKGLRPHFLLPKIEETRIKSALDKHYTDISYSNETSLGVFYKFNCFLLSILFFIKQVLFNDLKKFEWGNIYFGDLVYDTYLRNYSMGTLHRFDIKLVKTFYHFFKNYYSYTATFKKLKPKMVLVSHRVGISSGVFLRVAQFHGCDIFSSSGMDYGTLFFNRSDEKQKFYEYTITPDQLDSILAQKNEDFDEMYELIKSKHFEGNFNSDAKLAFSKKLYTKKEDFNKNYNLDKAKKNVFVMLHALTDHPLSHYNFMLFEDYCDWFLSTLEFAKTYDKVNWIFKQHPSDHFYPVKDHRFVDLARDNKCPHILFLGQGEDFDTRSIGNVGDAVVTCAGSAGFELSAFNAIPSVIAGDCPYIDAGFAVVSGSKEQYFEALSRLDKIERLDPIKHKKAIATYVFIHCLSRVEVRLIPLLSHEEMRSLDFSEEYFDRVYEAYLKNKSSISKDLSRYMEDLTKKDFRALRTTVDDFWKYYAESFKTSSH